MKKGSISVFLSLILIPVMILIMTLLESVRYRGLALIIDQAGRAASDSVFAGYDRILFDKYGLLFYDGSFGLGLTQYERIEEEFGEWFIKNTSFSEGGSFFETGYPSVEVTKVIHATDYQGSIFVGSVLKAFPFEKAGDLLNKMKKDLSSIRKHKKDEPSPIIGPEIPKFPQGYVPKILSAFGRRTLSPEGEKEETDPGKYEDLLNSGLVGQSKEVRKKGYLSLVIPKGRTISGNAFKTDEFPSRIAFDDRELSSSDFMKDEVKKTIFNEYLMDHFSCFTDGEKEGEGIRYGLEYLVFQEDSDDKNLKKVLDIMLLIRETMNLATIMQSERMRSEVKTLALGIVGWTGIEGLVPLAETLIYGAWSYAESLSDLKALLSGNRVPLLKKEDEFYLSLASSGAFFNGEEGAFGDYKEGLSYKDYLRLFLFTRSLENLSYAAMDLVQYERSGNDRAYYMMSQIYAMEFKVEVDSGPLFTTLPFVRSALGIPKDLTIRTWFSESYD